MAIEAKPGQQLRVTIKRHVNRESARKTLERLFLKDRKVAGPLEARTANFAAKPKRRGGRIWTKLPNKIHPDLQKGHTATIPASPQTVRDLNSVETFVDVTAQ
jgi:hypothetical protein